ncbi:MAG: PPC domain-containing protein [Synechococcales cyanobacterium T60_A2020_003]|nr:PPC domain-containing protein [Synechococcales cyanobacterium T60_A2020_003]
MKPTRWVRIGVALGAIASLQGFGSPIVWAQDKGPQSETILLSVEGVLEDGDNTIPMDGSLYDDHTFDGNAGTQVTITLESDEFDPYLLVFTPTGELLDQNDDVSEGDLTAQLVLTLPSSGTYTVLANAFDATGRGQYTLTVSQDTAEEITVQSDTSVNFGDYIGLTFTGAPPGQSSSLPGNPTHLGGWIIVPEENMSPNDLNFGVNNVLAQETLVFLFSEVIGYEDDGRAIWKVLDVTRVPAENLALNESHRGDYFPTSGCLLNGTADPEVFAIVRTEDQEFFSDIQQAWRANRQTLSLESLPVEGIRCANPGWGV